jgi:peptidoglycan/LPS O-acetylase OafA/YrhL
LLSAVSPSSQEIAERRPVDKGFYQPELDCLRFLAFLGVFIHHCIPSNPSYYPGWPHAVVSLIGAAVIAGSFGVPVFFALSAYLITSLLLRERERTGTLDTRGFYVRRILRIWPLYFVFLTLASVLPFLAKSQHLPLPYILGYFLLAGNWVHVWMGAPLSVAGPLWTVSIEEQFYLTWPLVMRKANDQTIGKIAIVLLIAANCSRVLLLLVHARVQAIVYNTVSCIDPIALGVLLALYFKQPPALSALKRFGLLFFSSLTMICVTGFLNPDKGLGLSLGRSLSALASGGILISFLGCSNFLARDSAVRYLGKISYGLYVLHLFGWVCAVHVLRTSPPRIRTIGESATVAGVALLITILLASMSYGWLETPFLRLKERFTHVQSRPV